MQIEKVSEFLTPPQGLDWTRVAGPFNFFVAKQSLSGVNIRWRKNPSFESVDRKEEKLITSRMVEKVKNPWGGRRISFSLETEQYGLPVERRVDHIESMGEKVISTLVIKGHDYIGNIFYNPQGELESVYLSSYRINMHDLYLDNKEATKEENLERNVQDLINIFQFIGLDIDKDLFIKLDNNQYDLAFAAKFINDDLQDATKHWSSENLVKFSEMLATTISTIFEPHLPSNFTNEQRERLILVVMDGLMPFKQLENFDLIQSDSEKVDVCIEAVIEAIEHIIALYHSKMEYSGNNNIVIARNDQGSFDISLTDDEDPTSESQTVGNLSFGEKIRIEVTEYSLERNLEDASRLVVRWRNLLKKDESFIEVASQVDSDQFIARLLSDEWEDSGEEWFVNFRNL